MHTPQLLHEAELNHSLPDRRGEMADRQTDTVSARPPPHLIIKSREQRWTFLVQSPFWTRMAQSDMGAHSI